MREGIYSPAYPEFVPNLEFFLKFYTPGNKFTGDGI
jgi:hypothetical protein